MGIVAESSEISKLNPKGFILGRILETANLDGFALNDDEKKLLGFSYSDRASPEGKKLWEKFDAGKTRFEFERKISIIAKRAYPSDCLRNQKERFKWQRALKALRQGDDYIYAMIKDALDEEEPLPSIRKICIEVAVVASALILLVIASMSGWIPSSFWMGDLPDRFFAWTVAGLVTLIAILRTRRYLRQLKRVPNLPAPNKKW